MKKDTLIIFIIALIIGMFTYFLLGKSSMNQSAVSLKLHCPSLSQDTIPPHYTCDGDNASPALRWEISGDNQAIKSFLLIVDDPDAQQVSGKTFVHWVVLVSANTKNLPDGISGNSRSSLATIDAQAKEFPNDSGNSTYYGPCPPNGTHTYHFTLFALDKSVNELNTVLLQKPCTADVFKEAMSDSIIAETEITGSYMRTQK